MTFELYTQVALLKDIPEWNLRKGDIATIVDKHPGSPLGEIGYSLEVFNAIGETIAVIALAETEIEPLRKNEVLNVRILYPVPA